MDRRQFLVRSIGGSVAVAVLGGSNRLLAAQAKGGPQNQASKAESGPFDLVAVRGGEPDAMFDKAIEALGGMGAFVKKGQRVLVKPNIGWDVDPERAGNTNPRLISRIIEHCYHAGAKEVFVFDHTCDNWSRCYKNSGIEQAVSNAGGKIVTGNSEVNYQEVDVPKGVRLTKAKVHEQLLQADVFLNVPILKDHNSARLTIGMKNLMGVVWDRPYWHQNDLHQCIADMASYRRPDLTIVDAYNVLKQNGPRGVSRGDVLQMKAQLVSTDPVAADLAATKLFGLDPSEIKYIGLAASMGLGKGSLETASIKRIKM